MKILKIVLSEKITSVDTTGNLYIVQVGSKHFENDFEDLMDTFENCTNYSRTETNDGMDIMIAYDDRDGNGHTVNAQTCYYTGVWQRFEECYDRY